MRKMKCMNKFIIIIGVLLFLFDTVEAQQDTNFHKTDSLNIYNSLRSLSSSDNDELKFPITFQSPQAVAFSRYGEYPVSHATGVPQINIPLYEIQFKDIKLPISISYHASGIKVDDVATPVGLGWVLNSGGLITRRISGVADNASREKDVNSEKDFEDLIKVYTTANMWEYYFRHTDTQSDRYIYNFNGNSGVFRFASSNKEILTIPYAPLQIKKTSKGFTIIDTDGIIYSFEEDEITGSDSERYVTAWYITKIESQLTGAVINFKYKKGQSYSAGGEYISTVSKGTDYEIKAGINLGENMYADEIVNKEKVDKTQISSNFSPTLLDEITWGNNKITLEYSSDRKDVQKERLKTITISNKSDVIRYISFNNNAYWETSDFKSSRMRLESVDIKDKNNQSIGEIYKFGYNNTPLPAYIQFPSFIQSNKDYWGYYNGGKSKMFIPSPFIENGAWSTNRGPIEDYMKACILEKIEYPTGGYTLFEYEANQVSNAYEYNLSSSIVGGLRVKSITSFSNGQTIKKSYTYSGNATQMIKKDMYQFYQKKIYAYPGAPLLGVFAHVIWTVSTSSPIYPITGWVDSPVFYNEVTEYVDNQNQKAGKTVYSYIQNIADIRNEYPYKLIGDDLPRFFHPYKNYDPGLFNPLLKSEKVYAFSNNQYVLKKETANDYSFIDKGRFVYGVSIGFRDQLIDFGSPSGLSYYPYESLEEYVRENVAYYNMEAFRHFYLLSSTVITDYNENGNIIAKKNYSYDAEYRLLTPIKTTVENSNGTRIEDSATYSFNMNTYPYKEMVLQNILSPVIKHTKSNKVGQLSVVENIYRKEGSIFVIDSINSGITGKMESRLNYRNYDQYSNPLYISKDNAIQVVYLWSYNGQYPIAEIKNASYADVEKVVKTLFGVSDINALSKLDKPNETTLKSENLQKALPNALVTTYTYQPLVGMTSMTDPRGVTTTYEYDSFGRLKTAKDASGKVINTYDYHYQNQ